MLDFINKDINQILLIKSNVATYFRKLFYKLGKNDNKKSQIIYK